MGRSVARKTFTTSAAGTTPRAQRLGRAGQSRTRARGDRSGAPSPQPLRSLRSPRRGRPRRPGNVSPLASRVAPGPRTRGSEGERPWGAMTALFGGTSPPLPTNRATHCSFWGGRDGDGNTFGHAWRYDAAAGTGRAVDGGNPTLASARPWRSIRSPTSPSFLGGQAGAASNGETWRFDPTTETCETLEKPAASAPRYAHSAVMAKGGNPVVLSPHRRSWRSCFPNAVATGSSWTWYGLRPACPLARRDST